MSAEAPSDVIAGKNPFSIEDVVRLARGDCKVFLNPEESYRRFLENTHAWLTERHLEDAPVYGVSTGVGAAVKNAIPERLRSQMPLNLLRFHGVGTGEILSEDEYDPIEMDYDPEEQQIEANDELDVEKL